MADDIARDAMRERAYLYSRPRVWKRVAQSYMALLSRICQQLLESTDCLLRFRDLGLGLISRRFR